MKCAIKGIFFMILVGHIVEINGMAGLRRVAGVTKNFGKVGLSVRNIGTESRPVLHDKLKALAERGTGNEQLIAQKKLAELSSTTNFDQFNNFVWKGLGKATLMMLKVITLPIRFVFSNKLLSAAVGGAGYYVHKNYSDEVNLGLQTIKDADAREKLSKFLDDSLVVAANEQTIKRLKAAEQTPQVTQEIKMLEEKNVVLRKQMTEVEGELREKIHDLRLQQDLQTITDIFDKNNKEIAKLKKSSGSYVKTQQKISSLEAENMKLETKVDVLMGGPEYQEKAVQK